MPNWTPRPDNQDTTNALRIVRTPPGKPLTLLITSSDPVGCYTHFAANRTIPCEGSETCPWCAAGYPSRWHGYLTGLLTDTLEHVIFEYTAGASTAIENYLRANGTLRGLILTSKRATNAPNSRLLIALRPSDPARTHIPPAPNLKAHLCKIWNVRYTPEAEESRFQNLAKQITIPKAEADGRYKPTT
jgi:hypothetical protein